MGFFSQKEAKQRSGVEVFRGKVRGSFLSREEVREDKHVQRGEAMCATLVSTCNPCQLETCHGTKVNL